MIFKQSTAVNQVWNRAKSPVLGLLLLLSVFPLLSESDLLRNVHIKEMLHNRQEMT